VLRIEDIDRPRVVAGAEQRILEDLRWLGLDWDEFYRQSERLALYDQALSQLERAGVLYRCFCTRADIARAASAPHLFDNVRPYPGTCRKLTPGDVAARLARGRTPSLRFRAPDRVLCFDDAIHAMVVDKSDDFVVRRADGLHAYQLAVVVDDLDMRIQEVVRGDDLISSTVRQLLLYEALGAKPPSFAHVPLVLGPDGQRLAKRHGSITIREMRQSGVSAARLVGQLAASLDLCERGAEARPQDLLPEFSFDRLCKEPAVFPFL
jgi:glutamyl-tRNA synthetase